MKVGYARVSTDDQSLALQLDALKLAGCDRIFEDQGISGSSTSRPALNRLLGALEFGDTLVTWKLDRLGRSLAHLIALTSELEQRGVAFVSISEAIDTRTASGRLLFHVMGALAEFERSLIAERTRAGIAAARERGRSIGRPPKLSLGQVKAALEQLANGGARLKDLADRLKVSPLTLSRALCRLS
jgi:DNA invertase Pin-like site-specific DNA recombinase